MIRSLVERGLPVTTKGEPNLTNQNSEETSFDQSLKSLAGGGARRDLLGSLGVAGLALLTALGVGEATAKDGKSNNGQGKKNNSGKSKNNDGNNQADAEKKKKKNNRGNACL